MGALIAVSLSAGAKASEISEENKKLTESLKESKEAYEELTAAMEEGNSGVSSSIEALKTLLAEEDKSASVKEQILLLVEQLNEALPGLGLSYDETTDSINMTTDALDQFAARAADQESHDAQIDRLVELREQYEDLTKQIDDTREKLESGAVTPLHETSDYEVFTNTFTPTEDIDGAGVEILCYDTVSDYADINIIAWKFEPGPVQTLAHKEGGAWALNDPPPNKTLERAKCQRYQFVPSRDTGDIYNLAIGEGANSKTVSFFFPLPTSMRKKAAVSFENLFVYDGASKYAITQIQNFGQVDHGVWFYATVDSGIEVGHAYYLRTEGTWSFILDANL